MHDLLPAPERAPQLLQDYLDHAIPQVAHMQAKVLSCDEEGLQLKAPLEPNKNHIGTVFGGSLNSMATLSAWGLVWLLLHERGAAIVIKDGTMKFLRPATEDFTARCPLPPQALLEDFLQQYEQKGSAQLTLNAEVLCGKRKVAVFEGRFVARKPRNR
ncbi:MAG: YiiD C-terminal domain-containing protein [Gammaproteobacteria bacterium]|nr:YiiD C-terminal domain-containing protein [Gammaproteobacteria bacterium]